MMEFHAPAVHEEVEVDREPVYARYRRRGQCEDPPVGKGVEPWRKRDGGPVLRDLPSLLSYAYVEPR